MKSIICFGEVLWDVLPAGRKLGGAPLNVSLRAQSFGNKAAMISSIGRDKIGEELAEAMKVHGGSLVHIQETGEYATSEVLVALDEHGTASYEIKMPCAWDNISLLERDVEAVKASDAFIYGSLVVRNRTSRETLFALLDHARYKVFDVNLRPPHYTPERIISLMEAADFVKFNDEELYEICAHLEFNEQSLEACISFISEQTGTDQICVTLGKDGAVLFNNSTFYYNKGYKVTVADTVGAGDSFLATIISQLLNGINAQEAINSACAVGSIVASKNGANPEVSLAEVHTMLGMKTGK
ncbi:MAG: carbohydrate kinase [Bacteroidetes bacterium]|nr:MAG: carbohydrate kinase [Bacteroidota bacterium]